MPGFLLFGYCHLDTVFLVRPNRVALLTDFGPGLYVGQIRLLLSALIPDIPVIDLMSDLPAFRPDLAAYLLRALMRGMPPDSLYLGIVDPGVGGARRAILVRVGASYLIGPDNGLFTCVARETTDAEVWRVDWRPDHCSASFHGRDLFTPIGARLIRGDPIPGLSTIALDSLVGWSAPDQSAQVIYVDHYGNLMTGVDAARLDRSACLRVGTRSLSFAATFCAVPVGQAFWYRNALGLVEIAVNQGRADRLMGIGIGTPVEMRPPGDNDPVHGQARA